MRLNDTTRTYFERLATISAPDNARRFNHIADPAATQRIQRYLAEHDPGDYSVLRTSIVPAMINAGFRSNVIPSQAEATLDIRALPDEDLEKLFQERRRRARLAMIAAGRHAPGMLTGATDMAQAEGERHTGVWLWTAGGGERGTAARRTFRPGASG